MPDLQDYTILKTLELLRDKLYTTDSGFQLESQVWARDGHWRDPYRALILFRLGSAIDDDRLISACHQVFKLWPSLESFITASSVEESQFQSIVSTLHQGRKNMQFIRSAKTVIRNSGNVIPCDWRVLNRIKHVGPKIAECVLGYGFGMSSMPVDGNVARVLCRVTGLGSPLLPSPSNWSTYFRQELKRITTTNSGWMKDHGLTMIDVYELFRLHAQSVCTHSPRCQWCPIQDYFYRPNDRPYGGNTKSAMQVAQRVIVTWNHWRQLLLNL